MVPAIRPTHYGLLNFNHSQRRTNPEPVTIVVMVSVALLILWGLMGAASAASKKPTVTKKPYDLPPDPSTGGKDWTGGVGSLPPGSRQRHDSGLGTFDFSSNRLFIDPECNFVFEGARFMPRKGDPLPNFTVSSKIGGDDCSVAQRADSVEALWNQSTTAGVCAFIDYLVTAEGHRDPVEIATRVFREVSPMCAQVSTDQWGNGLTLWWNDFVDRVTEYMDVEWGGGGVIT